jgi:hypothetical protein
MKDSNTSKGSKQFRDGLAQGQALYGAQLKAKDLAIKDLTERLERAEAKIAALGKELSRCENALLEAGEWE